MITIKIYGVLRLKTGVKEIAIDPKDLEHLTVAGTFPRIMQEAKNLGSEFVLQEKDLKNCVVMCNQKQIKRVTAAITDGDVLAFMSPAGGG